MKAKWMAGVLCAALACGGDESAPEASTSAGVQSLAPNDQNEPSADAGTTPTQPVPTVPSGSGNQFPSSTPDSGTGTAQPDAGQTEPTPTPVVPPSAPDAGSLPPVVVDAGSPAPAPPPEPAEQPVADAGTPDAGSQPTMLETCAPEQEQSAQMGLDTYSGWCTSVHYDDLGVGWCACASNVMATKLTCDEFLTDRNAASAPLIQADCGDESARQPIQP